MSSSLSIGVYAYDETRKHTELPLNRIFLWEIVGYSLSIGVYAYVETRKHTSYPKKSVSADREVFVVDTPLHFHNLYIV